MADSTGTPMDGSSGSKPPINKVSWFDNDDHVIGAGITVLFATLLYIIACITSHHIHEKDINQYWLDVGVLTFGVACGWLLGTIISPSIAKEAERFSKAVTAVSSFVSGFILSKASDIVNMLATRTYWNNVTNTFRLLMWLTGLLLAIMTTYVLRAYLLPSAESLQNNATAT